MTLARESAYALDVIYEIVVDVGETANKCTIAPLAPRTDFRLFPVHGEGALGPLSAPILLHHEGQCLTTLASLPRPIPALASVDCVWRRLPRLLERIGWVGEKKPILAKIPDGFKTVYPRVGSSRTDPGGGLATIEAIFIASAILGRYDATLLSHYYFAQPFIDLNTRRFLELGIQEVLTPGQLPATPPRARDSLARRRNRGRLGK